MRDLVHIFEFEELLQEAYNDLVRKGKEAGRRALGYTCYFMPEVLLDLPGVFQYICAHPEAGRLIWRLTT